jgi:deoxyribonuclease V
MLGMKPVLTLPNALTKEAATALQTQWACQVITEDQFESVRWVAGVDVAYHKTNDTIVAGVVILDAETLTPVEQVSVSDKASFPYIPGLFSFRELPPLVKAFSMLKHRPDLVVCDGHGIAHPRRFGLASHLGLAFDLPTIGCGKTRLTGQYQEPGVARGQHAELTENGETIGIVLRTQSNVKPVFVSIGHKISLARAHEWILKLAPKYRLPETTRLADQMVNRVLKEIDT